MSSTKPLISLVTVLALSSAPALAYGISISSSSGANVDTSFRQFETSIMDKLAECMNGAQVAPDSRFEVVIDQNGKVVDANFSSAPPPDEIMNGVLQKVKAVEFGTVPGISEGTITISFVFSELASPPYRLNSLRISSSGSIISGNVDVSGRPPIRQPNRIMGNRITGPIELGPERVTPLNRVGTPRGNGLDQITDLNRLNFLLKNAEARRRYDEAINIQKRIIALAEANGAQDKEFLIRSSLKLASIALDSGQIPAAQAAFGDALKTIQDAGEVAAYESTISTLTLMSTKMISKNLLDTADGGMRTAIDLDAIRLKNGITFPRVSLAYPLRLLSSAFAKNGSYNKAIALQRYRLEKCRYSEPENAAALVICQMDLASELLDAAKNEAPGKAKYLDESRQAFEKALDEIRKSFGPDSQEFKEAVSRRAEELTHAGETEAAKKVLKLQN